jgi:carbon monoxide dehydrogenase subunit G
VILRNEVRVPGTPAEIFALLNDVERVAGCLPGAAVDGRDGDAYRGRVAVKVGPITAAYAGTVRFLEIDDARRRLRLQARGSDSRGSGDAEAEVVVSVAEAEDGSLLRLETDLLIRGKIAQFGKGAISTVSDRLLQQFAANLGALSSGSAPAVTPRDRPAEGTLDGLAVLSPLAKYLPVAGAFVVGWLLGTVRAQAKQLKEVRDVR